METGLLIIDIQNDYFPGGRFPLAEPEAAAAKAGEVLARFREAGLPVVHVQHVWDGPGPFFEEGTEGVEIHEAVAPTGDEPVVQKSSPNAFLDTDLREVLSRLGVDHVVVAGMQTNLCIDASARAASDLGLEVTVVGDACAAVALEHDGRRVDAADVHAAFLAALAGGYATVVAADDLEV